MENDPLFNDSMHELAITQSILEITLRHAAEADASRVTNLYLVVGDLSSVVDDSVQFYWDMISEDTLAEGSQLHFRRVPIEIECRSCDHHYAPKEIDPVCPVCGGVRLDIVSGDEFYIEAIDVETQRQVQPEV